MTSDEEDDNEQLDNRNAGDDVGSLDKQGEDEEGQLRRSQIWYNQDKIIQTVSNLQVIRWFYLLAITDIPAFAHIITATRYWALYEGASLEQIFILSTKSNTVVLKRHYFASLILIFFILATITSSATTAYGHGIGADQSLPTLIANRSVAVSASLKPDFIESSDRPRLLIRTFDTGNNSTIPGISYRIAFER